MLYILLAGGDLQRGARAPAGAGDEERPRRRRGLHQPHRHAGRARSSPAITALLVVAAPWVMRIYLDDAYFTPEFAEQRDSVIDFARLCLPQVFFYGMFVLRRAGPQRPRPLRPDDVGADRQQRALHRRAAGLRARSTAPPQGDELCGGFTTGQEWLLGLGLHARHRRPAPDPAPLPARGRLPLPPALRLPRHRAGPHLPARHLDPALRRRQPGRLHRRRPARLQRHRGGRRCGRGGPAARPAPATRSTPAPSCW